MPSTLEDLVMLQPPTAERPLLGTVILLVEDSRHACEAMRLICQRSGARIRRAESLASAERHLRTYRPRIAVVDLGLPDGSGLDLIRRLARADPRIDGIVAVSGDEALGAAALDAGADAFLPKPLASVSRFQAVVVALLPEPIRPPTLARPQVDTVEPDPIALRDDLCLAADLLRSEPEARTIAYVATFLASLAKDAGDPALAEIAGRIAALSDGTGGVVTARRLAAEVQARIDRLELV